MSKTYLTGRDLEPIIKVAADVSGNDGNCQFSALIGALVLLARVQGIPLELIYRGIQACAS